MEDKTVMKQKKAKDGVNSAQIKTKSTVSEPNISKVFIKSDCMWEFTYRFIKLLEHIGVRYDAEFYRRYSHLLDYVYSKLALPDCDISDEYHVYEIIMNKTEAESKTDEV